MDDDIQNRIRRHTHVLVAFAGELWRQRSIFVPVKVKVYNAAVLSTSSIMMNAGRRHLKTLEAFYSRCLRALARHDSKHAITL